MARKKSGQRVLEIGALLVIILIPVGFVLYSIFGTQSSTPDVASQQTTPTATATQSTPTASIFLDDASVLPQTVPASQFIPFSFTIQNTGTVGGQIPFRVSVKWSTGEEDVIDENVVTLAGGASTTIPEDLKFEVATETAEVYLELPQTSQTSQFSLPRTK